jgi:transcriptional regulator with XRE-family HTH domain
MASTVATEMPGKRVPLTPQLLGVRIQRALEDAGVSKELAADRIDRSRETLDRYMRGNQNPSAMDIYEIGRLTGRDFGWFGLSDEDDVRVLRELAKRRPSVAEAETPQSRRKRGKR